MKKPQIRTDLKHSNGPSDSVRIRHTIEYVLKFRDEKFKGFEEGEEPNLYMYRLGEFFAWIERLKDMADGQKKCF